MLAYKPISFKNFKIVSPATFANKSLIKCLRCRTSDEHQQHLRSRLKYVYVNN